MPHLFYVTLIIDTSMPKLSNLKAIKSYETWQEMRRNNPFSKKKTPSFIYLNLPDSERLSFKLVNWRNYKTYLKLFQNDTHEFVDDRFRSLDELEEYAVSVLEYQRFSKKRGGCDWFIFLKNTKTPIGVLHIYDLNWEFMDGVFFPCMIGYALSEKYRNKGFAYEASLHLLTQIPILFGRFEVQAEPRFDNLSSRNLLEKLGFSFKRTFDSGKSVLYYKKLVDEIPKITSDQYFAEMEKIEKYYHP